MCMGISVYRHLNGHVADNKETKVIVFWVGESKELAMLYES